MIASRWPLSRIKRLAGDRSGNFAITTAFVIPALIGVVGMAIDTANLLMFKNKLQVAADTATLAAASSLASKAKSANDAKALSLQFLFGSINAGKTEENAATYPTTASDPTVTITEQPFNVTGKKFSVTMTASYEVPLSPLASIIGYEKALVSVNSTSESSTETKNALSMYFVLDRSGSMADYTNTSYQATCYDRRGRPYACTAYYTKIDSLKMAVASLLLQLTTADPDTKYARTGSVAYDLNMLTPQPLNWGVTGVQSYVNSLTASGGTSSTRAFREAVTNLHNSREEDQHKAKNGQVPSKYIVFMTDGDNNYASDDTATRAACDDAKKKNIEIFSVAFMAPSKGQTLLKYCASDANHYFAAEDTAQLVQAFKTIGDKAAEQLTILTQ